MARWPTGWVEQKSKLVMNKLLYWILRAKLSVMTLLTPWLVIKDLRAENEKLISTITDPLLTGINIGNGSLEIGMEGAGAQLMAGMFLGMFEKCPDAKNYIEVTFNSRKGPVLVTVTAVKPGGKTPDQLLREAKLELAQLRNCEVE